MQDPYRILGVEPDAGPELIKKAYRAKARELHPDHNPDDPQAEERFKELAAAWEILSDPARRAEWDGHPHDHMGDDWLDMFDLVVDTLAAELREGVLPAQVRRHWRGGGHGLVAALAEQLERDGGFVVEPAGVWARFLARQRLGRLVVQSDDVWAFELVSLRGRHDPGIVMHAAAFWAAGFREDAELRLALRKVLSAALVGWLRVRLKSRVPDVASAREIDDAVVADRRFWSAVWLGVGLLVLAMIASQVLG